jgi:Na+/H+-dicarboxylate symporter
MAETKKLKISLSTMIFISMLAGALMGIIVGKPMTQLKFIGDVWLNCIKMIIVPMILGTIITGVTSQKDAKSFGRIGIKIIAYYIITTLIACTIGLVAAQILKPGIGINLTGLSQSKLDKPTQITFAKFVTGLFSDNMFSSFTSGNIVQTLIIAILLGLAILKIKNLEHREMIIKVFDSVNAMIFSLIGMIMKASPVGIFFLMASTFATYGISVFATMASLAGTYYLACLLHILFIYGSLLWITTKVNPLRFLKDSMELWIYTISTCSSVAAIPVSMKVAREKFNVPDHISSFTIPLGSQMNYDGSVILYGCVITFIAQTIGVPISIGMMVRVVLLSAVLSSGGGGIPGSGIVKLLVMVEAFNLPTEIVAIIAAFYRIFDMGTTTLNCLGDLAGTAIIAKTESKHSSV